MALRSQDSVPSALGEADKHILKDLRRRISALETKKDEINTTIRELNLGGVEEQLPDLQRTISEIKMKKDEMDYEIRELIPFRSEKEELAVCFFIDKMLCYVYEAAGVEEWQADAKVDWFYSTEAEGFVGRGRTISFFDKNFLLTPTSLTKLRAAKKARSRIICNGYVHEGSPVKIALGLKNYRSMDLDMEELKSFFQTAFGVKTADVLNRWMAHKETKQDTQKLYLR